MVVSPGVRHLPELLSVAEITRNPGDIGIRPTLPGVREIFGLTVKLTNMSMKTKYNSEILRNHVSMNSFVIP